MIPFNKPPTTGTEETSLAESIRSGKLSGDGPFTQRCHEWFNQQLKCKKSLLTTSCTHALEMAALLIDIQEGDEVIMPSYTFVSTANAFVLRGAKIVFVDIRPDTMNLDESKIKAAITHKTKAIVPVHYAGVGCEMNTIMEIAKQYQLIVIEDAAQGMMSSYHGQALGSIGHLGAFSFHETKNYTSGGEGGLLIINDDRFVERAEIIREKGTNRSQFFRGMVDKYTWVDIGSSYLMNDLSASFLWAQLQHVHEINQARLRNWHYYYEQLKNLERKEFLELPKIPSECSHNAHMFYIKLKNLEIRSELIDWLKQKEIASAFHYVPLHRSPVGIKLGRFEGADVFTTQDSERLLRLPMYYGLTIEDIKFITETIYAFFER